MKTECINHNKYYEQKQSHLIHFEADLKSKNWRLPEGSYRVIFEDSLVENGADILRFRVTSLYDEIHEYWVRNRYRPEDKKKLRDHLINWLGEAEFRNLTKNGSLDLEQLYGREADVVVKFICSGNREPLRVIDAIAPAGTLVHVTDCAKN
jgi:hypothetical protein